LRVTAVDEDFAARHEAAVVGRKERSDRARFRGITQAA